MDKSVFDLNQAFVALEPDDFSFAELDEAKTSERQAKREARRARVIEAAVALRSEGIAVHPLYPKSKRPRGQGKKGTNWSKDPVLTVDQLRTAIRLREGIGARLGENSKIVWCEGKPNEQTLYPIAFDFDLWDASLKSEAYAALDKLFPEHREAPCVISGSRRGSRHFYALTEAPVGSRPLLSSTKTVIGADGVAHAAWSFAVYSTRSNIVLPPSIHPVTGFEYEWDPSRPNLAEQLDWRTIPIIPQAVVDAWPEKPGASAKGKPGREPGSAPKDRWEAVNAAALADIAAWACEVFPDGRWSSGAWRITSEALGRAYQEDLSIHCDGIKDFGPQKENEERIGLSPIWLLRRHFTVNAEGELEPVQVEDWTAESKDPKGGSSDELGAWLAKQLGMDFDALRTKDEPKIEFEDETAGDPAGKPKPSDKSKKGKGKKSNPSKQEGGFCVYPDLTEDGNPKQGSAANVKAAMGHLGIKVWYDEWLRKAVVEGLRASTTLDDPGITELWGRINNLGYLTKEGLVSRAALYYALQDRRNPLKEWLDSLKWDGVKRIERLFVDYAGAKDTPYHRALGELLPIAMVRRVRQPGYKFDQFIMTRGDQNLAKGMFWQTLAGGLDYFSESFSFKLPEKEIIEQTSGKWLIEAAELDGLHASENRSTKAKISRQVDHARLAFERGTATAYPRHFVIVGTTNEYAILTDRTGNRRYDIVDVTAIDIEKLKQDREQLFAEAAERERTHGYLVVPPEVRAEAEAVRDASMVRDTFADDIEMALEDKYGFISTSTLMAAAGLSSSHSQRLNPKFQAALGDVAQRLGWQPRQLDRKGFLRSRGFLRIGPNQEGTRQVDRKEQWIVIDGDGDEIQPAGKDSANVRP